MPDRPHVRAHGDRGVRLQLIVRVVGGGRELPAPARSRLGILHRAGLHCRTNCGLPTTTTSTITTSTSSSTTTTTLIDHVQCYEIKPRNAPGVTVTVEDQFGTLEETTRYPHRLCAPVSKDGEGILDPVPYLTGYVMDNPKFTRRPNQVVVNEFGTLTLDLTRPDILMVPSAKSLTAPIPPQAPPTLDHFQCYKVKPTRGTPKFEKRTVDIEDQLETFTDLTLLRPYVLCAPADRTARIRRRRTIPSISCATRRAAAPSSGRRPHSSTISSGRRRSP